MITEDYVSFETAKLLKDKGFNEPCEKSYYTEGFDNPMVFSHDLFPIMQNDEYLCPTLQMAMKWLREEYKIHIRLINSTDGDYRFEIYWNHGNYFIANWYHKTYEEAAEEAIQYCLTKII